MSVIFVSATKNNFPVRIRTTSFMLFFFFCLGNGTTSPHALHFSFRKGNTNAMSFIFVSATEQPGNFIFASAIGQPVLCVSFSFF
jgi:hypothetical protein